MRKLTKSQAKKIHELAHLPQRDVARRVGVSLGAVNAELAKSKRQKPAKTKRQKSPVPKAAPRTPPLEGPAKGEGEPDASPIERLTRAVKSLEHSAAVASADGDQARVVAALRAVSDVTKTIATLTPPAPPDHEAHPNMVEAAKRFREKAFGLFDRICES